MNNLIKTIVIFFFFIGLTAFQLLKKNNIERSNKPKAIICLTYDDGMETHLTNAIPQLDSIGLKGTFFLNSISGTSAVLGWKKAARKGHELGNHSLFHPCPRSMGWAEDIATENYSVSRIVSEVQTMDMILKQLDSSRTFRTYAFPCNNHFVGGQTYSKDLFEKGLMKFARTGGDRYSIVEDLTKIDPLKVPSWAVEEGTTADSLIAFAEKVKTTGGMGVFQFHGVGGQWLKVSNQDHIRLLQYLKKHENEFWITTFSEAMLSLKL